MLPKIVNDALSVEPLPAMRVYVKVSPTSASVVEKVPTTAPEGRFSAMDVAERRMSVGARINAPAGWTDKVADGSKELPSDEDSLENKDVLAVCSDTDTFVAMTSLDDEREASPGV
jgi:hypothetical protein